MLEGEKPYTVSQDYPPKTRTASERQAALHFSLGVAQANHIRQMNLRKMTAYLAHSHSAIKMQLICKCATVTFTYTVLHPVVMRVNCAVILEDSNKENPSVPPQSPATVLPELMQVKYGVTTKCRAVSLI